MSPLPQQRSKFLRKILMQHKYYFIFILIINAALGFSFPFLWFLSSIFAINLGSEQVAATDIKVICTLSIAIFCLDFIKHSMVAKLIPEVNRTCRKLCFGQIFINSYLFFKKNHISNIIKTVTSLSNESGLLVKQFSYFSQIIFLFISTTAILFSISKFLIFILFFWAALICIGCYIFSKILLKASHSIKSTSNDFSKSAKEIIKNYITVRMANKLSSENELLKNKSLAILNLENKINIFSIYANFTIRLITVFGLAAFASHVVILMNYANIKAHEIIFLIILSTYICYLTPKLMKIFSIAVKQLELIKNNLKFFIRYGSDNNHKIKHSLKIKEGKIEFKKVTLKYHDNDNSFKDKTLTIEPGQKVALVGLSGSGKTSFSYTIPGLITVTSGRILIDGQDISQVSQESLNTAVSVLNHSPLLFRRSIRENIAYGCSNYKDEQLIEAATNACCHDFIMNLEKGYDTVVGERGSKLTKGQKYRILIARAILKNAPIIIVDESDFDIDAVSAKQITEALDYLFKDRTAIIIAHWLDTLQKADRILVFEKGTIVEDGTHKELMRYDEVYASLCRMHDGGYLPATFDR